MEGRKKYVTLNIYIYITFDNIYHEIYVCVFVLAFVCTYATCVWFSVEVIPLKQELQTIVNHLHGCWVI